MVQLFLSRIVVLLPSKASMLCTSCWHVVEVHAPDVVNADETRSRRPGTSKLFCMPPAIRPSNGVAEGHAAGARPSGVSRLSSEGNLRLHTHSGRARWMLWSASYQPRE